eukprot:TRINITY_DN3311_c0_g1_i1.p1 TRINITY_DN3311_c0_g1~~TRINITY_DN3311_c0_g1_i1.p1  ORF type:complete len:62 (+),score=7.56 TRINITY_DN3311_c0_g1_i1:201-386(+)
MSLRFILLIYIKYVFCLLVCFSLLQSPFLFCLFFSAFNYLCDLIKVRIPKKKKVPTAWPLV